jgi:putative ABC transport system permease protein
MVAVNATNSSTLESINRFFDEASGQSDLIVESAVTGGTFDQEILSVIRRSTEIEAAAPGLVGVTVLAEEAADWEIQFGAGGAIIPGSNLWIMGRDPVADQQVHQYQLVDGRPLQAGDSSYDVLLVDSYADEKDLDLGDDMAILTPSRGVVELRVVGLIAKEGIGVTNEGVLGITPLSVAQELFDLSSEVSTVELAVEESTTASPASLETLRLELADRLGTDFVVEYPAARGQLVVDSLHSYQQGLDFFGVVSLFVGSFLIYNAFAMTVVERTREIGMFRAIGMTRAQVMILVLAEATVLGVFGSVAGVGSGLILARGLVASVSSFSGQPIEQVTASADSLLLAAIVGIVVTLAAAAIPAWQASGISPLQALHVQGNLDEGRWLVVGLKFGPLTVLVSWLVFYHVPLRPEVVFPVGSNTIFLMMLGATLCIPIFAGLIEQLLRPLIRAAFGNEGHLGSSNVNRARGRTTLTVAALMVGISMVVGINGLTDSFQHDIQAWVDTALGGDLFVRSPLRMKPDVETRLRALGEVEAVTRSRYVETRILLPSGADEYAIFVAVDPSTYLTVSGLRIQEGPEPAEAITQLAQGDGILIGADVANQLNLSVGDTATLETKRGQRQFRIVAVVIDFSGGETTTVTGSWRDLRQYFGINDVSTFFVRLLPNASTDAVADKIEQEVGRGLNLSVESKEEFEQKVRDLSGQAFRLFDVLGLIGLVVAALGIINTMLMNVMERTRELGGLRSIGMDRIQVQKMILAEAAVMGFMGAAFGIGFGAVLADVFILGLRSIGGFILTSRVPVYAMIYSFILAIVVTIVAAWFPAVRAGRVNIIAAIKHE